MAIYVDIEFMEGRDAKTLLKAFDYWKAPFLHFKGYRPLEIWSTRYVGGHMRFNRAGANTWRVTLMTAGDWELTLGSFLEALAIQSIHQGIRRVSVDLTGAPWRRKRWTRGAPY